MCITATRTAGSAWAPRWRPARAPALRAPRWWGQAAAAEARGAVVVVAAPLLHPAAVLGGARLERGAAGERNDDERERRRRSRRRHASKFSFSVLVSADNTHFIGTVFFVYPLYTLDWEIPIAHSQKLRTLRSAHYENKTKYFTFKALIQLSNNQTFQSFLIFPSCLICSSLFSIKGQGTVFTVLHCRDKVIGL